MICNPVATPKHADHLPQTWPIFLPVLLLSVRQPQYTHIAEYSSRWRPGRQYQIVVNKCLIRTFERRHCGDCLVTWYFADLCGLSSSFSQALFGAGLPFQNDLDRIGRCRRRFEFTCSFLSSVFGLRALERFGSLAEFARLNLIASASGS